jgi:CBS domain-containing protein
MSDPSAVGSMSVSAFLGDPVARVGRDASVDAVADLLVGGEVGALVVGDHEKVDGIVSERDLVRVLAARRDTASTRAIDIATTELVWCDESATVGEVATEMMEQYVRHVLVERDGDLIGIVSARDLLGAFAAATEVDGGER